MERFISDDHLDPDFGQDDKGLLNFEMISLIAAIDKNRVIGHENDLPWYLPEDLKHFRKLTTGMTVLMGRKTYDSIVRRLGKPLPGRKNVVVTRDPAFPAPEGVLVYNDLSKAISDLQNDDLFVIGGGQIFSQTIDLADTLHITHVDMKAPGDIYFPQIDPGKWKKIEEEKHDTFSFCTYKRLMV
ncbi:MAG: dihydrofolate reductase [bacterium]|nr:dihydrofolate reductase [bacterium]